MALALAFALALASTTSRHPRAIDKTRTGRAFPQPQNYFSQNRYAKSHVKPPRPENLFLLPQLQQLTPKRKVALEFCQTAILVK
ncbi:MAG TPA: hypothetical protein VGN01_04950 [Acidobacteriaceae bacterium]